MSKVFCSNCSNLVYVRSGEVRCQVPIRDNYVFENCLCEETEVFNPYEQNKNGDCEYYIRKEDN